MSRWAGAVVLLAATGYALAIAATHPFTVAADAFTALPIAMMALILATQWSRPRLARAEDGRGRPWSLRLKPYIPWLGVLALTVGWELANFAAHGPRSAHPTLSSMSDAVDRVYALKTVVVVCWILLGMRILGFALRRPDLPRSVP